MSFIAAPVAVWLGGGTIGAIGGAMAVGVVSGAVIGAAKAALTGGNIFEGALKGAVFGGVSAGIMSGLGMATGLMSADSQLSAWGVDSGGGLLSGGASATTPSSDLMGIGAEIEGSSIAGASSLGSGGSKLLSNMPSTGGLSSGSQKQTTDNNTMSDAKAKIYAGLAEGGMKGLAEVGSSMMQSDAAEDAEAAKTAREKERVANNRPGEFQVQTANIKVPDWWNKYLDPTFSANSELSGRKKTA